jgi:uncharacterized lipoprotein YmbA
LLGLLLAGCSSLKRADTTRFYVLSSMTPNAAAVSPRFDGLLFVAPVELASYLDNPGIVVRQGTNRVEFTEQHQWAQPLRDNLTQTLREDLAARIGNERVHPSGRRRPGGPFLSLQVRVDQFELVERKQAALVATWQVTDGDSGQRLRVRTSHLERPLATDAQGFGAHVSVLSELVAELAREISSALNQLTPSGG